MRTAKKTVKVRKAPENLDHMEIVRLYTLGELPVNQIAKKMGTSDHNVTLIVQRHWQALTNMREARALITEHTFDSKHALHELQNTELINEDFLRMLSEDNVALLSEAESIYSWVYVHTGNALEAMQTSNLDVGIHKDKARETRLSYDRAVILRSMYLNEKPNVAAYIKEIRETRLIDMDISKAKIQSELIEQLEYMKNSGDPRKRREILRTIELLGKTIGAFTENIQITEVSPSNALDQLIEMASEATIKEL
jgi:predicted DNA-binding protein (UPF0251 family)/hydrogenase maturation factor